MPLISILMAVYEPRMDWLREQLLSLEAQTYPNLRLYIRDDCSPAVPLADIEALVRECIRSFPWELRRNEENLGSNATFQRLTAEAGGDCFAYCDQDDIWLPEKLALLMEAMVREQALLVCSDVLVIDAEGRRIAGSISKVRRRTVLRSGTDLAPGLLFHNFVIGCTVLADAATAKAAVPFCPHMVHDQYLALWCAERGRVYSVAVPLLRYRIHGNNQTGPMAGVTGRASYLQQRIERPLNWLRWLEENFPCGEALLAEIRTGIRWEEARVRNWNHRGGKRMIWKYRMYSPIPALFEILFAWLPEPIFRLFITVGKKI